MARTRNAPPGKGKTPSSQASKSNKKKAQDPDFKPAQAKRKPVYSSASDSEELSDGERQVSRTRRGRSSSSSSSSSGGETPPRQVKETSPPLSPPPTSPALDARDRSRSPIGRPSTPEFAANTATSADAQSEAGGSNSNGNAPANGPTKFHFTTKTAGVELENVNTWSNHSAGMMGKGRMFKIPKINGIKGIKPSCSSNPVDDATPGTNGNTRGAPITPGLNFNSNQKPGSSVGNMPENEQVVFNQINDYIMKQLGTIIKARIKNGTLVSHHDRQLITRQSHVYRRADCINKRLQRSIDAIPKSLIMDLKMDDSIKNETFDVGCNHLTVGGDPLPCKSNDHFMKKAHDLANRFDTACKLLESERASGSKNNVPSVSNIADKEKIKALTDELEKQTKETRAAKEQFNKLKNQFEEQRSNAITQEIELNRARNELSSLNSTLATLTNTNVQMKTDLEEMRATFNETQCQKAGLISEKTYLEKAKSELEGKYEDCVNKNSKWQMRCKELEITLDLLKTPRGRTPASTHQEQPPPYPTDSHYRPPPAQHSQLPPVLSKPEQYVPTPLGARRGVYRGNDSQTRSPAHTPATTGPTSTDYSTQSPGHSAVSSAGQAAPPEPGYNTNQYEYGSANNAAGQSGSGYGNSNLASSTAPATSMSVNTSGYSSETDRSQASAALPSRFPSYDPEHPHPDYTGNNHVVTDNNQRNSPASDDNDLLEMTPHNNMGF